jgi:L-asparagine transporter-like permease
MGQSLIYGFIATMWILMLVGGGILVLAVSQISIQGYGELDFMISSVIKAIIAILLVIGWVLVLTKLKNKIFQKQIKY